MNTTVVSVTWQVEAPYYNEVSWRNMLKMYDKHMLA